MLESDPLSHMYSGDSDPLCVRLLLWSRVSSALEGDLLAPFRPFPSQINAAAAATGNHCSSQAEGESHSSHNSELDMPCHCH